MSDNVDEFECAIHLGSFEEPKLLNCHHTFCRKCLEDLAGTSTSIKCPLCNKISIIPVGGVRRFSTNFYLSTEPSSSAPEPRGRDDKEYCLKHPDDLLKCFCEDCNTITCSTCLLLQHKNHKFFIIKASKDVILKNYKEQKDSLKRKLDELKKVKEVAEESLKEIAEHRQTALTSYQNELQKNYDQNQEKLNTVLNQVNTKKSQIETTAVLNPTVVTTQPISILREVIIMKGINKEPSKSYFPPIQYLKFKKKEENENGINSVGRLESVMLSIPYTHRSNTWGEPPENRPVLQHLRAVFGGIGNCLTKVPKFHRDVCEQMYDCCCEDRCWGVCCLVLCDCTRNLFPVFMWVYSFTFIMSFFVLYMCLLQYYF